MYFLAPEPPGARARRDAQVALTTLAALVEARPCGPTLAFLDLREIANANASLPSRLRCPVLFRGVAEWCGAAAAPIMRWDWKRLAASGPQALEYDESHEANFTYWDNSTLFAAAVRERGVRAQRHTRQVAVVHVGNAHSRPLALAQGGRARRAHTASWHGYAVIDEIRMQPEGAGPVARVLARPAAGRERRLAVRARAAPGGNGASTRVEGPTLSSSSHFHT